MIKILVVDDEPDLCEILRFNLESEGYSVDTANSAEQALRVLSTEYQLLLLDVMMDKMSGFQLAHKIRTELGLDVPIIFLTAKNTENDILTGFNIGADDYITKPFSLKEVLARTKAALKRIPQPDIKSQVLNKGTLSINENDKTVTINGEHIILTKKEFLILHLLVKSPHHFYSREDILNIVWEKDAFVLERSVDVHIARLRKKLGAIGNMIINRPGFGYAFNGDL